MAPLTHEYSLQTQKKKRKTANLAKTYVKEWCVVLNYWKDVLHSASVSHLNGCCQHATKCHYTCREWSLWENTLMAQVGKKSYKYLEIYMLSGHRELASHETALFYRLLLSFFSQWTENACGTSLTTLKWFCRIGSRPVYKCISSVFTHVLTWSNTIPLQADHKNTF